MISVAKDSPNLTRNRLRYAWRPFFSRYGRLSPIQTKTIPKILDGLNVVASAPTASGKTESVVAPVAERCMAERWEGLSTLYIVPTRALANDMLQRLAGPLGDMGLKTALKHGDRPTLPVQTPNWLITTPESLDSLLCRKSYLFQTLRTVIIDEIHLLDGTARGDQLRLLLVRLRQLVDPVPLSVHLLSATLASPDEVAQRYTQAYAIVTVLGQREADYQILASHEEVKKLARDRKWKKILYFCNQRKTVEKVAAELTELWAPYPVVIHHGSLSRQIREKAEQVMKEVSVAICVSTSTLEIGIDIGDIDVVVLVEQPNSTSALLQRVGRGSRRSGKVQAVAIAQPGQQQASLQTMLNEAILGTLSDEVYEVELSVAVQQIFSYLYQYRAGVKQTDLIVLLSQLCSEQVSHSILQHLSQTDWIQSVSERWYPATPLLDLAEKGRIHSNIANSGTCKVIDVNTGKEIGMVSGVQDEIFLLARQAWKVLSIDYGVIRVQRFRGSVNAATFARVNKHGAFHHLLPPGLS
ncbi:MAG: DEAD/DEAH box helicase [Cyanobacteria bacterium J06627_28]